MTEMLRQYSTQVTTFLYGGTAWKAEPREVDLHEESSLDSSTANTGSGNEVSEADVAPNELATQEGVGQRLPAQHSIITEPDLDLSRPLLDVKQKWEGEVLGVKDETFTARLVHVYGDVRDQLIVEIYRDKVHTDDADCLVIGATFYWIVGYHIFGSRTVRKYSEIRFRRLPTVRLDDEQLRATAQELLELFDD